MNRIRSAVRGGALLLLAVSAVSCGPAGPALHPVSGSVFVNEKPAEGATVVLEPTGATAVAAKPTGVVSADGSFTLQTYPYGAGAPAGEYAVLVTWYPPNSRQVENPKNKLPAQYGDPATTPLPRVTVTDGSNTLEPFKLTTR